MTDEKTTLAALKASVAAFRDERDWTRFHGLKDLSAAIAVEAAELQELFLWTSAEACTKHLAENAHLRARFEEELAHIVIFSLSLGEATGTDSGHEPHRNRLWPRLAAGRGPGPVRAGGGALPPQR